MRRADTLKMNKVLVTGVAGFIGAKVAETLLRQGISVVGVDDLNGYYDVRLKEFRLNGLGSLGGFSFQKINILDRNALSRVFRHDRFDAVLNLAAQAGVVCSVGNPYAYLAANTLGTLNLLELSKEQGVRKFILSSSSSVYTGHSGPFSEDLAANTPYSPYAASKKAAEAFCHSYQHLYGMDVVIARYFTAYGPAGRPDMAPFKFIQRIQQGRSITIYGNGIQTRDFTYVDDIAEGTVSALKLKGYHIVNFGSDRPVRLIDFIRRIERYVKKKAIIKKVAPIKADAKDTWADISKAKRLLGWSPKVDLDEGLRRTVAWYLENQKWASKIKLGYNASALS
jgi:nucleoside-diphosphate-sugar epimerase